MFESTRFLITRLLIHSQNTYGSSHEFKVHWKSSQFSSASEGTDLQPLGHGGLLRRNDFISRPWIGSTHSFCLFLKSYWKTVDQVTYNKFPKRELAPHPKWRWNLQELYRLWGSEPPFYQRCEGSCISDQNSRTFQGKHTRAEWHTQRPVTSAGFCEGIQHPNKA